MTTPYNIVSLFDYIPTSLQPGIQAGTDTTNLVSYIQQAVTHCVQNNCGLFCPAGTYTIDATNGVQNPSQLVPVQLNVLNGNNQGLFMFGEGCGKTIFREAAQATVRGGRYTTMFQFSIGNATYPAGSFTFLDMTFDKNGGTDYIPPNDPPSLYAWEQAHIMVFNGTPGCPSINSVTCERCEFLNKVGGGLVLEVSTCTVNLITVRNLVSVNHPDVAAGHFGERGCTEAGINCYNYIWDGSTMRFAQIEPVTYSSSSYPRHGHISNCKIDKVEVTDSGGWSWIDVCNTRCASEMVLSGTNAKVVNTSFLCSSEFLGGGTYRFTNCTIWLPYNSATNVVTPFQHGKASSPYDTYSEAHFENCEFVIDPTQTVSANPTGFGVSNPAYESQGARLTTIHNCTFDSRLYGSVNAYANGDWVVRNSRLAGATYAVQVGGYDSGGTHYGGNVILENNNFDAVAGKWINILRNNTYWTLKFGGAYAWNTQTWGNSAGTSSTASCCLAFPLVYATSVPGAVFAPAGFSIENIAPSSGNPTKWSKITTDSNSTSWKPWPNLP